MRGAAILGTLLIFIDAAASTAHAARPMITDDARIVDAKSCQVETWSRFNREIGRAHV